MNRTKGFTLIELMVGVVVMGIMGLMLTQMLVRDSRFVAETEAMMNARQPARAAMNMLGSELAMVGQGGLTAGSATSITVRVPYAFGILCDRQGANRIGSLVPTDSIMFEDADPDGVAWRAGAGVYTFMTVTNQGTAQGGQLNNCFDEGIDTIPGGPRVRMQVTNDTMPIGAVFYMYQTIRYQFAPSVDLPGRLGLWRKRGSDADEELLAPFDTTASFAFFVGTADTAQAAPADLTTVIGLELNLVGASEATPQGSAGPPSFAVSTRVNFLNNQ